MSTSSTGRPRRVVVLGGGFGGAYAARELERVTKPHEAEIVLVDRNNYFVFYPLLVEAGTGSLEPRHAVVSIRSFLRRSRFRKAEVLGIDHAAREVRVRTAGDGVDETIAYDQLVIALGSVTRRPPIPGLAEHAFELKQLVDAVAIRDHLIERLEAADRTDDPDRQRDLLRMVVVGGSYTGVEVAGELHEFLRSAARDYRNVRPDAPSVLLVERAERILPTLDEDLASYARRELERRGAEVCLDTSVDRIEADHVRLSNGRRVGAGTVVWCAGIAPPSFLDANALPRDEQGYLRCDPTLAVEGTDGVWAIGDCARNPGPDGEAYPATAQHAVQQGKDVARNVARVIWGEAPVAHEYRAVGTLAALGCRTGVARVLGVKLSGFPAWFLWRTVYLAKMPGWARRLRVALDWTLSLVFRRDPVSLGIHRMVTRAPSPAIADEPTTRGEPATTDEPEPLPTRPVVGAR